MERREFIQKSAKGTIALGTAPLIFSNSNWKGANDRVNVAVIGIRGMGQSHIREYQKLKNVEVTALCDVDENLFAERVKKHFTDKKKILQFEVRHWMTNPEGNHLGSGAPLTNTYMTSSTNVVGNIFYGSKGYMLKDVDGWQAFMGKEREPGESGEGLGNHYRNFIDAIRANDPELLTAPIEEGFYSCALIHLANISYRLGRTLDIDPQTLTVLNDEEANSMLTKEYRKPYVLPKKV